MTTMNRNSAPNASATRLRRSRRQASSVGPDPGRRRFLAAPGAGQLAPVELGRVAGGGRIG